MVTEATTIAVSKLDAAKRQLDCGISLWAADKDAVSIHTLTGAAHEIVSDLNKKRGNKHPLFDADFVKDEYREEFRKLMRKDIMFFKHADRDPDAVIEFAPLASMMYMSLTIHMLRTLGESLSDIQLVFHMWLMFHKPDWINDEAMQLLKRSVPVDTLKDIKNATKKDFFELSLKSRGILRANGHL
jgi:hypothetical protein